MDLILAVDDNVEIVSIVEFVLKRAGYEVIGANGGKQALEILEKKTPDLILLDIMMPYLDGWETLRLIRQEERLQDVPVTMLTAKQLTPETTTREDITELVDYIQKPFTSEGLVKKVDAIFESLENIAKEKARLSSESGDRSAAVLYENAARQERLNLSLISTLNERLKEVEKVDYDEADKIRAAIRFQEKVLDNLKGKRRALGEHLRKKTNIPEPVKADGISP